MRLVQSIPFSATSPGRRRMLPLLFAGSVMLLAGAIGAAIAGDHRIDVLLGLLAISLMIAGLVLAAVWWRADARARRVRPVIPLESAAPVVPGYALRPVWRHKRRAALVTSLASAACLVGVGWCWWQLHLIQLLGPRLGILSESWMLFAFALTGSLLGLISLILSRGYSVVGWLAFIFNAAVLTLWLCD